jgi:hypothetical protein
MPAHSLLPALSETPLPGRLARWLLLVLLLATLGLAAGSAREASAAPVEIAQAPALEWGFKTSWRTYAGQPAVAGGATVIPGGAGGFQLGWAFDSGSYDAETRATVLQYRGSVHWKSHSSLLGGFPPPPGWEGPDDVDLLDLQLTDPRVEISRDTATITAQTTSRNATTWQLIDYGRIEIVDLLLDGVTPTVAGGATTWSAIPATIADAAGAPFGETYYPKGTRVDSVSLSYTGPGGAPDLADHFDVEDQVKLGLSGDNVVLAPATTPIGGFSVLAVDSARQLLYYREQSVVEGVQSWTYKVFDLETMRDIDLAGPPLTLPNASYGMARVTDTSSGKVYVGTGTAALGHWFRYDADLNAIEHGDDPGAIPTTSSAGQTLSWDPIGERAFEVVRHVPDGVGATAYDSHQWQLKTYTRQSDGTWEAKDYDLPNGGPNLNATVYQRGGAVAGDGSFVILGNRQISQPAGAATPPATFHGAYRVVLHEDGTAATTPIPGTVLPNVSQMAYTSAIAGGDGYVAWYKINGQGSVQRVDVTPPSGETITAEPVVDLGYAPGDVGADGFAIDPQDGTVWAAGAKSRRIVGVRDGRLVADQVVPLRNPRGGPMLALPGGRLVMQSGEGDDGGIETQPYGFQELEQLGTTATIAGDPQDRSVTLAADEEAEDVSFAAAATADPAPTVRWQSKAPGSTRFANVAGETAATLTVAAERGMDGTQYRAVYSNPAGQVATEVATLEVRYAPRVTLAPLDRTTVPGQDATFDVLADGNPEPQIAWQRRVSGYWQSIEPDDENFEVRDGQLVVLDTNLDQSGSLFRARLGSDVATVYTRTAKLTVAPPAAQELVGVHLDWTGSEELQRKTPNGAPNYFSAGVSDGSQSTYASAATGVRVMQVAAGGGEQPASWATRDQHLTSGGTQLVRLVNGTGSIAPDGSATVTWAGSFSVNMYGGLLPFTVANPVLHVGADGRGSLTATLSGYSSSQLNPNERTPLAPATGVTIATFSDGRVDPASPYSIAPDYAGVEAQIPVGQTQQDRIGAGWGAWPQSFVDFQLQTGLGSYWYSSGGAADPLKAPHPFVVSVTGTVLQDPSPQPDPDPQPDPNPRPKPPVETVPIAPPKAGQPAKRLARVARLACPARGTACRVAAPKRTTVRIAGKRYTVRVLAPKRIRPGRKAAVRVRLPKAAAERLQGGRAKIKLDVAIVANGKRKTRTIRATIRG